MQHKVLIIGLGSMGKRRIRNLKAIGSIEISGFDTREDRRSEAKNKYGIQVFASLGEAMAAGKYTALVISVPPDLHHVYMKEAIARNLPFFVEASVVDTDYTDIIRDVKTKKIVAAPSSTLYFHPAVKKIGSIIKSGELGSLSTFIYHSGQYLPDWHTYEHVSDFYVSKKETGGAREIVPFELSWITQVIGFPKSVAGIYKKTICIEGGENIDDTYSMLMDYGAFILNLTVDVVSRAATRKLLINGEKKQLLWNWDENCVKVYDPGAGTWEVHTYETAAAAEGYNKNITEQMYIDEMKSFLDAVDGKEKFVNDLEFDHRVLKLLYAAESSYDKQVFEAIQ